MSIVSVYCKCLLRVSIVSVYCKCLLRLSIVSVYCQCLLCFRSNMLKHHVFYTVPLGNDETAWVVLRFRSKMLLFECVLLCFCSHMCKKPYKYSQKSCFLHIGSPNPLFYRCKFLAMFISRCNFSKPLLLRRSLQQLARSAAGCPQNRFTLCVCFCVFPSLMQNENPIRSETSVREL